MLGAFWSELRYRLRTVLRRDVVERELDDELRFHIEREAEKYLAQGLTREEAFRRARTEFGGREQIKEECRDVGRVNLIEDAWNDLRHGVRGLRRSPGFTGTTVLILTLGIGASTAIFSVAYGVLLRSLPYEDPAQLVRLYWSNPTSERISSLSPPQFVSLREQIRTFTDIAIYSGTSQSLTGRGEARWLDGARVSAGFFEVMGAEPILGRTFVEGDNLPGSNDVVVISHALWEELGGESADILGQTLRLYERPKIVVGVMPAGFDFPNSSDVWLPIEYDETFSVTSVHGRGNFSFSNVGRLGDGVAPGDAQRELEVVANRLEEQFPRAMDSVRLTIDPLHDTLVSSARTPLLLLIAAVGLLLLIACANVAGLLLARAAGRQEELAVRAAIGAGRGRLVRQLLTESLLVGAIGGALGLLLAMWATRLIVAVQPEWLPRLDAIRVDGAVLAFGLGITLLTTLLVGLVPALQATEAAVASGLRQGGRGRTSIRSGVRMRAGLVVAELALAVLLLSGAGLLMRSFVRMISTDPGFRTERVLAFQVVVAGPRYDDDARRSYFEELLARIAVLPGVESTGAVHRLPILQGGFHAHLIVEGHEPANPYDALLGHYRSVSPGYFETMGIPVLRGRGITERDREGTLPVVVINETAARDLFGGEDPVGQRIRTTQRAGFLTVVGIVGDVPEHQPINPLEPAIFWPFDQDPWASMNVVARSHDTDPLALAPAIRHTLRQVDENVPGRDFQTLERIVGDSVARERFLTALLVLFASAALLLASIGVFGLLSFTVAQRTREIGVRIALGAMRREIMTMVLRDALKLGGLGVAIGVTGALLLGRLLEGLLYEVSPTDPATIGTMAALLLLIALVASWLPARRAAAVDPMTVLRHE